MFDVVQMNSEVMRRVRASAARAKGVDVAIGARPNLFLQPGGDTEVAIGLRTAMARFGVSVDYRQALAAKADFGLVHLLNIDLPLAFDAISTGRPFVVTSLYEDLARFRVASMVVVSLFKRYAADSDRAALEEGLAALRRRSTPIEPSTSFRFVAEQASAIFATGATEAATIRRDFPKAAVIEDVPLAFERPEGASDAPDDSFSSAFGVKDFILCVGRLETRKNQLMLLHALEDDERPLVFVNSTTVEPEYEALCRSLRRRGPTIFTGRISRGMLAGAFRAAAAHVLPSWYELPGLVTLEAAWHGCPVVAPDWGTLPSYLGDSVDYCEPNDPASIRRAVERALGRPRDGQLRQRVEQFSWDAMARRLVRSYRAVREQASGAGGGKALARRADAARAEVEILRAKGSAMNALERAPSEALALTKEILRYRSDDAVVHFIHGLAALREMSFEVAARHLQECVARAPLFDGKTYLYLYLALCQLGRHEEALATLEEADLLFPFRSPETDRILADYKRGALRGRRVGRGGGTAKVGGVASPSKGGAR